MTSRPKHEQVERRLRELLESEGMPAPDEVAHWRDAVAFYWHQTKAIIVVDLDEIELDELGMLQPAGFALDGECDPDACDPLHLIPPPDQGPLWPRRPPRLH